MQSCDGRWMMVVAAEFEIHDFVSTDAEVGGESINKSLEVFLLHVENIAIFVNLNTFTQQLIYNRCAHDQFKVIFLVELELIVRIPIQMNTKIGNINNSLLGVPQIRGNLFAFFILHDDFPGEAKIAVEPSSPETATIFLDVHLLETASVFDFVMRSQLQNWRVSVAADDFENAWATCLALVSEDECDDGRCISSVVVCFSRLQIPFITLSKKQNY